MKAISTSQIIAAFEKLQSEDPETFYNACGYGDDGVDIMHKFISGSYELGLIAGAKYAIEHLAELESMPR